MSKTNDALKDYVLSNGQGFDEYWISDYILKGIHYGLVFTDNFEIECVNVLRFDSGYWVVDRMLPEKERKIVYQDFLNSIT